MPWTWERIEREWLGENRIAHLSEVILECFNEVERRLGDDWIKAKQQGGISGSIPAAGIVGVGEQLMVLRQVHNPADLVEQLRAGKTSAWAELAALYAVVGYRRDIEVELEPDVDVKGRLRKPDFRVRHDADPWTYVEVSRPDTSDEREQLVATMRRAMEQLLEVEANYALEVYLRREPTQDELETIIKRGEHLCRQAGANTEDLPNQLGVLVTNDTPIGAVIPKQRDAGDPRPIIGLYRGVVTDGIPQRHVIVRLVYSDDRADLFLGREARQLPPQNPGLIVLETTETRGSEQDWIAVFGRRLQPQLHTRVSGIMLISGAIATTSGGAIWKQASRGIVNPNAVQPLPRWIAEIVSA